MGTPDQFQKWIVCDARSPVSDVAYIALAARLRNIHKLLTKATREADEDIEHVHRIRVASRRAVAALEVFGPFASRGPVKRVTRYLRRVRKAAGRARDLDVLIRRSRSRGTSSAELRPLKRRRKKAQKRITKIHRKLVKSRQLQNQIQRLLRSVPNQLDDKHAQVETSFAEWARDILRTCSDEFFAAWPRDVNDLEALHAFRIKGKRLRYMIELVASAFPDPLRSSVYPQIVALQDGLGTVNDHLVASNKLSGWAQRAKGADSERLEAELSEERRALESAIDNFERSWNEATRNRLAQQLGQLIESTHPEG
jgi:CHAD domain-containing protein